MISAIMGIDPDLAAAIAKARTDYVSKHSLHEDGSINSARFNALDKAVTAYVTAEESDGKRSLVVKFAPTVEEFDRFQALTTRAHESAPAWKGVDPDRFQAEARGKV